MLKCIIIILFLFIIKFYAVSQTRIDIRLDSLKERLHYLKDSLRIDCLNALSEAYIKIQIDTAEVFALQGLKEAENINYTHGIAEATSLKATILFTKYSNFHEAENLARKAILLYANTPNKRRLNRTYYELGHALYAQSYFEEAIHNFGISYDLSKKVDDSAYIFYSVTNSAYAYLDGGDYKKAFEKVLEMHQLVLKNNNLEWKYWESAFIIGLYMSIEDFNTALKLIRQDPSIINSRDYHDLLGIAELFSLNHQFDSAKYYFSLVDTSSDQRVLRMFLVTTGEYYFLQGRYDKALPNFLRGLSYHKQVNDRNQVMQTLVNLAKNYDSLHDYTSTFKYANEALTLAQQTGARQFIRDCYQILCSVYKHWNQADSALFYHERYVAIKDSIISEQVAAKLVAYNFDQKIEALNKEKEMQQVLLQKQSLIKNLLVGSILILLILAFIIFRNIMLKRRNEKLRLQHELELQKLESERAKAELQQQATELEMQALRAQMNPHFIFNCLNAINQFILTNDSETAADYLTRFSRLIRMVLNNSQRKFISLDEELETLHLYLYMEHLRFTNKFHYSINCDGTIDALSISIPPMLLQPFVENAIWHGLMHKEERGELLIDLHCENSILHCTIRDNGVGRNKAAMLKSKSAEKSKSMGIQITKNRMVLLSQNLNGESFFEIHDIKDAIGNTTGTMVCLKIKIKETADESAP